MPEINISQKKVNEFIEAMNHRMSRIENDVKWMRRIGYYMAAVMTTIGIKLLFL